MTDKLIQIADKNKRVMWIGILMAVAMFGFGYALVPLYNVMCKVIGINGKTSNVPSATVSTSIDMSRTITVLFLSTNNESIPWEFHPNQNKITLHPGENKRISYFAKNNSGHRMTVQAIPSVSPGLAAKYIRKTECFCFTQQTFDDKEQHYMPIIFRLDPELPKNVNTVVLSYTLFDATKFAPKAVQDSGRIS